MIRQINPKLKMLAKLTSNPDIALPELDERFVQQESEDVPEIEGYIYVPLLNLYVAKGKSLHGKNWYEAHAELHKKGFQMLTLREFFGFISYLKKNKEKIKEASQILDDILARKRPYRAEWLDAKFSIKRKKMYIHYNHRTQDGKLQAQENELLKRCLIEDCSVDLQSINSQGLPTVPGKDTTYFYPRETSVAMFYADPFFAYLSCFRNPKGPDSYIGVRAACKR